MGICIHLCSPVAKGKGEMLPPARPGPQSQARSFENRPCHWLTPPWTNHLLSNLRLIVHKRGIRMYRGAGQVASQGGAPEPASDQQKSGLPGPPALSSFTTNCGVPRKNVSNPFPL